MSIAVELPALGESVVEGTVSRWLVKEGDAVEVDQPLVEVTTDKVDAEIPAPGAGIVTEILVGEGETVPVGTRLAVIEPGAAARATGQAGADAAARAESAPPAGLGPAAEAGEPVPAAASAASAAAGEGAPGPRATPVARRLAQEAELDLAAVEPTGPGGRVTKEDVLRHAARDARAAGMQDVRAAQPPAGRAEKPRAERAAASPGGAGAASAAAAPSRASSASAARPPWAHVDLEEGDEVVPMTPQRRLIAEHMVYSKRTSPHVGTVAEIDMGAVTDLRARNKESFQRTHGIKLTFLPFVVYAVVRALRDFPMLNASVIEDAIVLRKAIHVGIAVETEKGLLVPVVRHADRLSLPGLAVAIDDLSSRARSRKLSPDDLRGGTFTVSNPGRHGNLYGFAIINQPQVGIVRMGEMVKRPVVRSVDGQDAIAIRPIMHLALSYDHRAVDGAPANGFLHRIRELLEAAEFEL